MKNKALGVCYYPEQWNPKFWEDDAKRMREVGISVVRIGEFAWSRIEPKKNLFEFEWLDEIINILAGEGHKIVLCTPTATPPKWLVDSMPDMIAVTEDGQPRKFGSRRHYCLSHEGYKKECRRIATKLAQRYGKNQHIIAWQVDNEYGCHDTTLSYSNAAKNGFQKWLKQKYKTTKKLNEEWGNVFWSMEVSRFNQVELPNQTVTEANPAHRLDFYRYSSEQTKLFNLNQVKILKKYTQHDVIHNFMGKITDFDHFDVANDLDIVAWDSYPLGFVERYANKKNKNKYMRTGHPDFQAFHHDLYRACGQGRWWVMEQQPGPVNWADWNPEPVNGMVRAWTHEAFAHGAEVVSYFRWRQPHFAQEQMHTALNRPNNTPDVAMDEVKQVAQEIKKIPKVNKNVSAEVAIVFDYPSIWASNIQPHAKDYDGFNVVFDLYKNLRKLGVSIDFISQKMNPNKYKLIIAPNLIILDDTFVKNLKKYKGQIIFGARTGSRTTNHQIPQNLPPGKLQELIPIRVLRVESIRPGETTNTKNNGSGNMWLEQLEMQKGVKTLIKSTDNKPLLVGYKGIKYLTTCPDDKMLQVILKNVTRESNTKTYPTGENFRIRDNGNIRTIINYGKKSSAKHLIKKNDKIIAGKIIMECGDVTIVQKK